MKGVKIKDHLLITLADKNFIDQAKQLFSCAHFNAGWRGDYLLLAHEIPEKELDWFKKKGILIKKCEPLLNEKIGIMPSVTLSKFYLFTPYFKKWSNVVFFDGDIIIRASLDELMKEDGFAACANPHDYKLRFHFSKGEKSYDDIFTKVRKQYDLQSLSFNAGMMAFNTSIIGNDSLNELKELLDEYGNICRLGDQSIFNLYFYNKWTQLSPMYSSYPNFWIESYKIKPEKIRGVALHFAGFRNEKESNPWDRKNQFYTEWKKNLDRADKIDLDNLIDGNRLNEKEMERFLRLLNRRKKKFIIRRGIRNRKRRILGKIGKVKPRGNEEMEGWD